jgi:hypothetical protein
MNAANSNFNYESVLTFVTVAMAERWLSKDAIFQRPINERRVNEWVRLMQRGEFHLTHQGIAITANDEIVDGRHRLKAIVKTGIPRKMLVVYNADPETFPYLDRGFNRNNISILRLQGFESNSNQLSALNSLLWNPASESSIQRTWSVYDLPSIIDYFEEAMDFVFAKGTLTKFATGYARGPGLRAIASNPVVAPEVARFYHVLAHGTSRTDNELVIIHARERLSSLRTGNREGRWNGYWIVLHALKNYLSGSPIKYKNNIGNASFMESSAPKAFESFVDAWKPTTPWGSMKKPKKLILPPFDETFTTTPRK